MEMNEEDVLTCHQNLISETIIIYLFFLFVLHYKKKHGTVKNYTYLYR